MNIDFDSSTFWQGAFWGAITMACTFAFAMWQLYQIYSDLKQRERELLFPRGTIEAAAQRDARINPLGPIGRIGPCRTCLEESRECAHCAADRMNRERREWRHS